MLSDHDRCVRAGGLRRAIAVRAVPMVRWMTVSGYAGALVAWVLLLVFVGWAVPTFCANPP
ncbi:MAG: hypothetical protein HYR83_08135 [Planctomycetes bacterium]|nr:hypothetical protein [Planctomycetota bacterium]